jgi:HAD superfamily hydrolase (TIGR01549 family)
LFDLGGTLVYRIVSQERMLRLLCEDLALPLPAQPDWSGAVATWRAYHAGHYLSCRTTEQEDNLVLTEARLILDHLTGGAYPMDALDRFLPGLRRVSRWWGVYDDVAPVLDYAKATGTRTGLISNWEPSLPAFCRDMGLAHAFPTMVSSVAEGIEKPSPRIFEMTLERMGIAPEETVYIGDDYRADEVGARAAGITPILLDRNDRYLGTDCLKIRRLDEVIDFLQGNLHPPTEPSVCFSGYAL